MALLKNVHDDSMSDATNFKIDALQTGNLCRDLNTRVMYDERAVCVII